MNVEPEITATASPAGITSRPLVGLEQAMRVTDVVTPFNVVSVLRLKGNLLAATLRSALDVLPQRHPLLRATIRGEASAPVFHFDTAGPIPLETGDRPAGDGWIAVAEEELHRPFDLATGPLLRCRYLADRDGGDLVVTIHHTIVDAVSALQLFKELLALCGGGAAGGAGGAVPNEGEAPAPSLYPDAYRGLGFARAVAAFMGRQMADEMAFRWRSRGVRKAPIAETGRCCLLPIRFSPALTAALVQASRRQRITLNAILGAAMMAAVQRRLYPSPRVPLRHIIFADMRSRLRKSVPDAMLGCFLTMFRFTVLVKRDGDFWALARDIQDATTRAAQSGERFLAYSMSPGMMKMIFKMKAFRMGATALSYTGPIDLPTTGASFQVTGVHAFAANMTLGPEYSALVRLFRGELWWDILYLDSDMDAAGARAIAREMESILEGAAC